MKKIISLILCAVMVIPFCVSCKKTETEENKTYIIDRTYYSSLDGAISGYHNTVILGRVKGDGEKITVDDWEHDPYKHWTYGYVHPIEVEVIKSYSNDKVKPGDILTCVFPYKEAIPDLNESLKMSKGDYGVFFMFELPIEYTEGVYTDRRIYVYDEIGNMRLMLDENNNVTNKADLQKYLLKDIDNLEEAEEKIYAAVEKIRNSATPEIISTEE